MQPENEHYRAPLKDTTDIYLFYTYKNIQYSQPQNQNKCLAQICAADRTWCH